MYKKHSHSHSSRKKILLAAAAGVLVLLIAAGTVVYLNKDVLFSNTQPVEEQVTENVIYASDVEKLALEGKGSDAITILDEEVKTANGYDKAFKLNQKAELLMSTDPDAAIAAAVQAAEAEPDNFDRYANVAEYAVRAGKKDVAIANFEKAIEVYNANPPEEEGARGVGYYQMKLESARAM